MLSAHLFADAAESDMEQYARNQVFPKNLVSH